MWQGNSGPPSCNTDPGELKGGASEEAELANTPERMPNPYLCHRGAVPSLHAPIEESPFLSLHHGRHSHTQ